MNFIAVLLTIGIMDGPLPWPLPDTPDVIDADAIEAVEYDELTTTDDYAAKSSDMQAAIDDIVAPYDELLVTAQTATGSGGIIDGVDDDGDFNSLISDDTYNIADFYVDIGYAAGVTWSYALAMRNLPPAGPTQVMIDVTLVIIGIGLTLQAVIFAVGIVKMLWRLFVDLVNTAMRFIDLVTGPIT
jgi:hypothetical protein